MCVFVWISKSVSHTVVLVIKKKRKTNNFANTFLVLYLALGSHQHFLNCTDTYLAMTSLNSNCSILMGNYHERWTKPRKPVHRTQFSKIENKRSANFAWSTLIALTNQLWYFTFKFSALSWNEELFVIFPPYVISFATLDFFVRLCCFYFSLGESFDVFFYLDRFRFRCTRDHFLFRPFFSSSYIVLVCNRSCHSTFMSRVNVLK